tara:strand:- start:590 stop:1273 length:684 start_codon:yes stop_codon:yes gene_type:complete
MVITAFFKALSQITDPKFIWIVVKSSVLTALVFLGISILFAWGVGSFWSWVGLPFMSFVITIGGFFTFFVGIWVFGPAVIIAINSIFLSDVIRAVEVKYYPNDLQGKEPTFIDDIASTFNLVLIQIILNICIVPFLFFPPIYFILYWFINAYLFGREYFEMVFSRFFKKKIRHRLKANYKYNLYFHGLITAILFTLPLINIFVPLISTASMIHLYKKINKNEYKKIN